MDGLLVIDKPAGPTSHDVVARLRRVLRERRIGHTGTLDPAATGVLPLVLGRATRLARFLSARDKQYEAVIRLGTATDTYDAQGVATGVRHQGAWPSRREIEAALAMFRGTSLQQPPAFSAKKIDGKRSHKLARGQTPLEFLPAPVAVTAHIIDITSVEGDLVTLTLRAEAGSKIVVEVEWMFDELFSDDPDAKGETLLTMMERLSLRVAQRAQDFVLDTLQRPVGTLQSPPTIRRELDDVTSAIGRIAASLGESATLEHIQQQDAVVRIQMQCVPERLLRHALLVAQVRERHVLLESQAQHCL